MEPKYLSDIENTRQWEGIVCGHTVRQNTKAKMSANTNSKVYIEYGLKWVTTSCKCNSLQFISPVKRHFQSIQIWSIKTRFWNLIRGCFSFDWGMVSDDSVDLNASNVWVLWPLWHSLSPRISNCQKSAAFFFFLEGRDF